MSFLDIFRPKKKAEEIKAEIEETAQPVEASDAWGAWGGGRYAPIVNTIYNGEKNFGELGPVLRHVIDHNALGQRAWQMDLESETCHTIIKQKGRWTLGTGLMLQCEPQKEVLASYGITIDPEKFNKSVEALWKVYAYKATTADYANRASLHKIAKRAFKNASVRGDALVVLRVSKNNHVTVQLIDGQHVATPPSCSITGNTNQLVDNSIGYDMVWTNGNRVRHGVEIDETGQHLAYHVRVGVGLEYERIAARDKQGSLRAYLVYSSEYRLDNTRGIPDITPNMESSKQLDEYTDAAVSSAAERAKIVYTIEHDVNAQGIDPRAQNLAKVVGTGGNLDLPRVVTGEQKANDIAITTSKNTFNMAPGSKLASLESKQEIHYKEFFETRWNTQCATLGMPPEVASQLYGGSYSASRAATNGFQYSLNIDRSDFGDQFYQPIFNLQLDIWVLTNAIQAPGYLDAMRKQNETILAAYRFANWFGSPVPQIDELKEVQAARLKLGVDSANYPISTFEKVAQDLGEGNYDAIVQQYKREIEEGAKAGIEKVTKPVPVVNNDKPKGKKKEDKPAK